LPQWIERVLPGAGQFAVVMRDAAGQPIWSKTAPRVDQKVKRVCVPCNTGWMHRLEDDCIPLLTPALRLESVPLTFNEQDQRTVAFWAIKTAFMLEFVHLNQQVPREHYTWLYEHRDERELPAGCFVWLATYAMDRYGVWSEPTTLRLTGSVSGRKMDGYCATFAVGHLATQGAPVGLWVKFIAGGR
jgi:hypothetical protein